MATSTFIINIANVREIEFSEGVVRFRYTNNDSSIFGGLSTSDQEQLKTNISIGNVKFITIAKEGQVSRIV